MAFKFNLQPRCIVGAMVLKINCTHLLEQAQPFLTASAQIGLSQLPVKAAAADAEGSRKTIRSG